MKQRSSDNWKSKSGVWDSLNTRFIDFDFDYPVINCEHIEFEKQVNINDYKNVSPKSLISSFVDDYILERFWRHPHNYINLFLQCNVMSPDFSLLVGMPKPLQQFQVYKNRFVGYIWQSKGLNVIPTISWSDYKSFEYCFEGVSKNSIVAISNIGCRNENNKRFFDAGFNELKLRIDPKLILFMCNNKFKKQYEAENVLFLDSFWNKKRVKWAEEADRV